jgi:hypothetical protein
MYILGTHIVHSPPFYNNAQSYPPTPNYKDKAYPYIATRPTVSGLEGTTDNYSSMQAVTKHLDPENVPLKNVALK